MDLWPHQQRGVDETLAAIAAGQRRIVVTSPTGGGKTRVMLALARHYLTSGRRVVLYTNRKLLTAQTSGVLTAAGLEHGVRSAGYVAEHDLPLQIASIATEHSRAVRRRVTQPHAANLVLVDEGHLHTGRAAQGVLRFHRLDDAPVVYFTATPLGMEGVADCLIVAGTASELRQCGALVWAHHHGPDEPDLRRLQGSREGQDLTEKQNRQVMMRPGLWGRVWEWFQKLNPEHRPTILFGPDVAGSLWFAEEFTRAGVRAAHVDGAHVWIDGHLETSTPALRQEILEGSESGAITVLCNRFVLREGIDAPWLAHGILATVFGSLQSYVQSGGRLLRSHPALESVTIQDHGGNWWRHGSLNADRVWDLSWTGPVVTGLRAERLRQHRELQPFRCPRCALVLLKGTCPNCGWQPQGKHSRPVVTAEGGLIALGGDVFKPRRLYRRPNGPQLWEAMYHRSCTGKGQRTFRAAEALFAAENHWQWPDRSWPLMPTREGDWFRKVAEVPRETLT